MCIWVSQVVLVVKNPAANAGDMRHGFDPWVGKIHWRRAWQSTAVFLPGAPHGQRSLTPPNNLRCVHALPHVSWGTDLLLAKHTD